MIKNEFIFDKVPFSQCHASSLLETNRGSLLAVWFGGSHEGNKDVKIWMSSNEKDIWSRPIEIADGVMNESQTYPCWNPVLFKSNEGKIFLFYKVGPNPREWWGMYKTSLDAGKSWTSAVRLPDGIIGPVKNKPIQLKNDIILSPSSTESKTEDWKVHIERSKDNGKTWQIIPVDPETHFNVIQPSILEYPDGRLQILCRSKDGNVIESWSNDQGETWSKLSRTELLNPNSGTDAVSLKNGAQIIVYNPLVPGKEWFNGRYKISAALSQDGKRWTDIALLEDGTKEEYSYPAIIQTLDGKVHITYTFDRKNIKHIVLEPI
ncbi:sialidase family protein [Daejeonella lutea]|nr:sialidase family protein [Daejeonella lutea]